MEYVLENGERAIELMACFLSDEIQVAQRAAHVVGLVGREAPKLLLPWLQELTDVAEKPVHEALRRNVIRYFSELKEPIPAKLESQLIELCGKFVADKEVKTAIGAFAMQFVADRANQYPTAAKKLIKDLNKRLPDATPGFQNRARKVLAKLAS